MRIWNWVFAALIGIVFMLGACSQGGSNKGDELFNEGKYKEAISAYNSFLASKPKNVKALYNRGRSYEELGEFKNAEKDFLAALDQDSKNIQVLLSLSNIYQKQKNHSSALLYADYAVEIPGAPAMAYFMKGRALHQIGNTQEALREYSAAIKMDKDFGQAYYYRGMLKIATDKKKSGCEDISLAIRLNVAIAQEASDKYCK
ncbi:TPR repeat-containing protein [Aquiflexum balticum DSM 16537]|uniref:TPR repeat-containing protein n=1 Tax=Aquiflexum balticum DSM 16537 TaxID=758820 RepID=A0A1W2H8D0_9BACT|nr:tetratricopeptide repeat protein [Aquiflexum balticum]SMD45145.1 TPR repeat-containing protein [Aquiflexum balticum DSM 16537]